MFNPMTKFQCDQALRAILCDDLELPYNRDEITDATLLTDLELDSLQYLDLSVFIDTVLGVRVRAAEIGEMRTYGDLLHAVWAIVASEPET